MTAGLRRLLVLVGTIATAVVMIAGVAVDVAVTAQTDNPFTVQGDGAGNPLPFTISASGMVQNQAVFVQQCDGVSPATPQYSSTDHCDLASGNAPVNAAADGTAVFAFDDPSHTLNVFKGESPQSLFNCLGPTDPPLPGLNGLTDFRNCQVRVSVGTPADTANQAYFSIVLPDYPDSTTTTSSTSTSSTSTSSTTTTSTSTSSTSSTTSTSTTTSTTSTSSTSTT